MKLRIASDLHVDHHKDRGTAVFAQMADGDFDVLVVAGDIANANLAAPALVELCAAVKQPVIYVPGNHDYYGTTLAKGAALLRVAEEMRPNLRVLDNDETTVDGQRFVGSTLWFPHPGYPLDTDQFLGDFHYIQDIYDWITKRAQDSAAYLERHAGVGDVVVTHHFPHPRSVALRFAHSALNRYFLHNLSHLVERGRMKTWIHGHTHDPMDYEINSDTRVVCNPGGYPGERRDWAPLDVEV